MAGTRRLLARLRALMAAGGGDGGEAALSELTTLIAAEMVAEVCTVYAMRPGDILELVATHGLRQDAVGRTRLRVGEGIVGIAAATGAVQNLPDAQNHPAFAYRPETGEDPFASLLAVPLRRAGRVLGVLTVQNRLPRRYSEDEVEVLETVAMLLAELLAASGTMDASEGIGSTLPRQFDAVPMAPGLAIGPVVVHGLGAPVRYMLAEDPAAELRRVEAAAASMQQALDALIEANRPDGDSAREVLEATRLVSADEGWLRRVRAAVESGFSAEAAVHRVSNEVRDRMRRVSDPYLRERLADLEELAERMLAALDGGEEPVAIPKGAILLARRLGPAQLLEWHSRGIGAVAIEEGSTAGHAAILARALGLPAIGGAAGMLEAVEDGDEAILDADEGQLILRPAAEVCATYRHELDVRHAIEAGYALQRDLPAQTADGVPLSLQLNVGLAREVEQLDHTGAAGIGLFRTEVAMLARGEVADVPEQAALYARVLDAAGDRPVRFRTLDLGGDKLLPGAPLPVEENPAMGWRSLRIGLDRPKLLRRQLRALLLAASGRRAFHHVPDGDHRRRVPRRQEPAVHGGGAGAAGAEPARGRQHDRSAGAPVPASGADGGGRLRVDRLQRPDAVPVRGRPRHARAVGPLRPAVAADAGRARADRRGGAGGRRGGLGVRRACVAAAGRDGAGRAWDHHAVHAGAEPAAAEVGSGQGAARGAALRADDAPAERVGAGEPARPGGRLGARA